MSIVLINRCLEKIYELFIRENETVCLMTRDCDRKIKARFKRHATAVPSSIDQIKFDFSTVIA